MWRVNANIRSVNYEEEIPGQRENEEYRSASLDLSYRLTAHFSLRSSAGYEDNDYAISASADSPEGEFYSAGFQWDPNQRVSIGADYGYRYFGNFWNADVLINRRRDTFRFSYSEDISSQNALFFEEQVLFDMNPDGSLTPRIDPITGELVTGLVPGIADEVFIRSIATFDWQHTRRRSTLTLHHSMEHRDYQEVTVDEDVIQSSILWEWTVSRQTIFNIEANRQMIDRDDDSWQRRIYYGFGLERILSRHAEVRLNFIHTLYDEDENDQGYVENVVTAGMLIRF
jgi:uncharacterized protein (PEP-CTERM system associated)